MRRIAVPLLVAALLSAGGVIGATPAAACSCVGATTQEHFERADAVFSGRLVSRTEPSGQTISSSADPALLVFAVDTVFKGSVQEEQDVLSPMSGASCGLEVDGDGPFVVFATRSAELGGGPFATLADDQFAAFLCGGTAPATDDLAAELRALAGPAASGTPAPADDGGVAAPPGTGGTGGPDDPGLPTAAYAAGALVLVLAGALLLRRRRTVH